MNPSSKKHLIFKGSIFVLFFALIYLVFRGGTIDKWFTGLFYAGSSDNLWPLQSLLWVQIAYKGGSVLTVVWGVGTILVFILGFWMSKLRPFRMLSILCFLLLAIGPGLIVNSVLKDHWGRPRPRETQSFGGEAEYQSPFVVSDIGGKSFPCGHCSVGFALSVFAFWNRRAGRRRRWTLLWWMIAVSAGGYLGLARISVGAHYLSDVFTSGAIVVFVAWLLDVLLAQKIISTEIEEVTVDRKTEKKPILIIVLSGLVAVIFAAAALIAFPYHGSGEILLNDLSSTVSLRQGFEEDPKSVKVIVISNDPNIHVTSDLFVSLNDLHDGLMTYNASGFGFPWSHVEVIGEFSNVSAVDALELRLKLRKSGFFNELNVEVLISE